VQKHEEIMSISQIIRGRAAFYGFFSQTMRRPPTKELLNLIKSFIPHFQAVAVETEIDELQFGTKNLADFAKTITDTQEYLNKLNREYTMLFLLGHTSIPTCESAYLSPEKLLKQKPWEEVMTLYGKYKLGIPVSFKEPEDHICIEFLFMSDLAGKCANALDSADDLAEELILAQKNFLHTHINRWVPEFCARIGSMTGHADTSLYNSVALLISGLLKYDTEFMEAICTG
jgi:TorA maturation chaperone TorD